MHILFVSEKHTNFNRICMIAERHDRQDGENFPSYPANFFLVLGREILVRCWTA